MLDNSSRTHELTVQGSAMATLVFEPERAGPFPAMVPDVGQRST